jgi:lipopolysaccharide transport system permease protein
LFESMRGVFGKLTEVRKWMPLTERQLAQFDLLRTLVRRDLEGRYKGSVLGNLWPLVNQLSQLLIYTYVFSIVLNAKLSLVGVPESNFTYGLWLFAGILPWISFTGGLIQAASSVISQPNLVKKVVFPLALLPLVPVLSTFVESAFGLIALIFFVALTTHTLQPTLALLPFIWLTQLCLTSGLAYLTASLTVFLRDIPQSLGVILNLWFYITPIVYPVTAIPANLRGLVFWLNPIATISEVYRDIILVGEIKHWSEWGITSTISAMLFFLGFKVYRRLRSAFSDVL